MHTPTVGEGVESRETDSLLLSRIRSLEEQMQSSSEQNQSRFEDIEQNLSLVSRSLVEDRYE